MLRALPHVSALALEDFAAAERLLEQAVAIDPDYALASVPPALCYYHPCEQGWARRDERITAEAIAAWRLSVYDRALAG